MNFYKEFFNGKQIAIFGMGIIGLRMQHELAGMDIKIQCFSDNSKAKIGTVHDGVMCIAPQELATLKEDIVVIVSVSNPGAITKQLKNMGFQHVYEYTMFAAIPKTKLGGSLRHLAPFGHYYSLYPNIDEIFAKGDEIFSLEQAIHDIEFHENEQIELLRRMGTMYDSSPAWMGIDEKSKSKYRYKRGNQMLSLADAIGLHCMLRIIQPKQLIEVGSGYTSAVTLDTNEFYLNHSLKLTFIEPYANRLKSILKETDQIHLIEKGLQEIPVETFDVLDEGDILFIDSTHVSKINSDVNYLFFEILPRLKKGVIIHLHDIFYPFEYPKEWIFEGKIWNELYLLRAFLQNNHDYKILFFQHMMEKQNMHVFLENWRFDEPIYGGSIWIEKAK